MRGLPLFYSYIRLMREGEKERDRKEAAGGETKRVCIAAEERKGWVNEWKDEGQRKQKC